MRVRSDLFRYALLLVTVLVTLTLLSCGDDDNPTSSSAADPEWYQMLGLPTEPAWWQVYGFSASDIFAAGEDGLVYRGSYDSWDSLPASLPTEQPDLVFYSIWGNSPTDVWVAGTFYGTTDLDTIGWDTIYDDDGDISDIEPITDNPNSPVAKRFNGVSFNRVPLDFHEGLFGIWGWSDSSIVTVGDDGRIAHYVAGTWETLTGEGSVRLTSVWMASDTVAYAVGYYGTALRYHLPSGQLTVLRTGLYSHLWQVWGFSENDVYTAGVDGTVMHWDGQAWSRLAKPCDDDLYSIWGTDPANIYVVGENGAAFRYNGSTWTELESGTKALLLTVWGSSASDIYMAGQTSLHCDGGSTCEYIEISPLPKFNDVWVNSSTAALAVGDGGTLLAYSGSWSQVAVDESVDMRGVWWPSETGYRYAVGTGGTVLRNRYIAGSAASSVWTDVSPATTTDFNAVWGLTDTLVTVVGDGGKIWQYDGSSWTEDSVEATADLNDIWGIDDSVLVAVGEADAVYVYTSGWQSLPVGVSVDWNGVWGFADDDFYIVGDNGAIYHYTSAGWSAMASPTSVNLSAIWGSSSSDLYAVGEGGVVLHYNGTAWTELEDKLVSADLTSVHGASSSSVIVGGDFNCLLRYAE